MVTKSRKKRAEQRLIKSLIEATNDLVAMERGASKNYTEEVVTTPLTPELAAAIAIAKQSAQ